MIDETCAPEWNVSLYSQRRIDLSSFSEDIVDIGDIAHSLSLQCRYNGHCKYHYSVAQHCVYVHNMLRYYTRAPHWINFAGLLHDASEAYLQDIIRGCKRMMPSYLEIEDKIQNVVYCRYGIPDHRFIHKTIKYWDNRVLRSEVAALFANWKYCFPRAEEIEPALIVIEPWSPAEAEEKFLAIANDYIEEFCL